MPEEKKVTTKKATTSKKATSTKTTEAKKAPTKKASAPKVEAEVKVEKKAPAKKTGAHKVAKETSRLQEKYNKVAVPALMEKFQYKSIMQVPKLIKIVVNIGVGDATVNSKFLEEAVSELTDITGQKPIVTKARKSIATFKLREGQSIGCKVTLRGVRMYYFLDKLISIALPRVRDFRGVSKTSFDGRGNYTLGIKEQSIFPEIEYVKIARIRGMDIVIVTSAKSDEEGRELLTLLGMPFQR